MKKILALLMTLTLVISTAALPALAEEADGTTDAVSSATAVTGKGSHGGMPGNDRNGQQPPSMPGNGRNGQQPPAMSGSGQNGQQPPAMPESDQNCRNDRQAPSMSVNGQNEQGRRNSQQPSGKPGKGKNGKKTQLPKGNPGEDQNSRNSKPEMRLDFEQLVRDGVIDQELCEKIMDYMKEHAPQAQSEETVSTEGSQPPALPDGTAPAEGSEPPAAPANVQGRTDGMEQSGFEEQLLKDLLDNSIITREQYDLLLAKIAVVDTAASSAAETTGSGT